MSISKQTQQMLSILDAKIDKDDKHDYTVPAYDPYYHYLDLANSRYFYGLLLLRHGIKLATHDFFTRAQNGVSVDLFMLTPSISSPQGPGSDSEVLPIRFGQLDSYLVDSAQFGFEPLLLNGFQCVYCYLPSLRGEEPDYRHLNQFYHAEAEVQCALPELRSIVEAYLSSLAEALCAMPAVIYSISSTPQQTFNALDAIREADGFTRMTFSNAVAALQNVDKSSQTLFEEFNDGRDITPAGERYLSTQYTNYLPIWIENYDRDRTPFYHKPNPQNPEEVINADLIFPPLTEFGFSGEIVGAGQRQDDVGEMHESLRRQGVSSDPYEWYINLRRQDNYTTTSGFGMGVERFITWLLGQDDIKHATVYPRLKNIETRP